MDLCSQEKGKAITSTGTNGKIFVTNNMNYMQIDLFDKTQFTRFNDANAYLVFVDDP